MNTKVAVYARVSSDRQDVDLSISAQLRALREYASRNNHDVAKEYVDEAESGKTADRPQMQQMIADARRSNHPFDLILVWKFSRFARNREDAIVFKSLLKKHGVRVVSITEPSEDSPTGRLLEAIIETLDEFYSANLAQETLRGMRESASRGTYLPPYAPYGYNRVKIRDGSRLRPSLEIDPARSPVVERIFQDALSGNGLKEICRRLNDDGIPPGRGSRWSITTLHYLLTNEAYSGTLIWGRTSRNTQSANPIRVDGAWPALISRDVFDNVQSALKERAPAKANPARTGSKYLLSGLVRCGICNKMYIGQEAKSGRFAYYVCGTLIRQGAKTCSARYVNASRLEEIVLNKIKESVLTDENLEELVRLVNEELEASSGDQITRLEVLDREVVEVQRRLDRLYEALETGKLGLDDLSPRIHSLRIRLDQMTASRNEAATLLSEHRIEMTDPANLTSYVEDLQSLIQEGTVAEQKGFIRNFVKEIIVDGKEGTLSYTMPMRPHQFSQAQAGVLDSIRLGCRAWIRTRVT